MKKKNAFILIAVCIGANYSFCAQAKDEKAVAVHKKQKAALFAKVMKIIIPASPLIFGGIILNDLNGTCHKNSAVENVCLAGMALFSGFMSYDMYQGIWCGREQFFNGTFDYDGDGDWY